MKLQFCIKMPDVRIGGPSGKVYPGFLYPILVCLEALSRINVYHLKKGIRDGRPLPRLYQSGVRYQSEPPGKEDWLDIPTLYEAGIGDCEDLACALVAERRVYDGIRCLPHLRYKQIEGINVIHILCAHPDGRIEDPSKLLGMDGEY